MTPIEFLAAIIIFLLILVSTYCVLMIIRQEKRINYIEEMLREWHD